MGEKSRGNFSIDFGDRKKIVLVQGKTYSVPWDWVPGDPLPNEEETQ